MDIPVESLIYALLTLPDAEKYPYNEYQLALPPEVTITRRFDPEGVVEIRMLTFRKNRRRQHWDLILKK